ncbi:MAG: precorrin-6y C5,15-methyltransferase (decarboxylating) subunit CbiE [Actinomycetota bacterium]
MTPWLSVIGIGEDGEAGLNGAARTLLDAAEVVVGGARHLALVATKAERRPWPSPFAGAREMLEALRGRPVVVLASGDPMWFGIGATLARWLRPDEYTVLPHPGAFSLAAARLKWPLQDCLCLTAHGRPVETLALHLAPGRRLLVLSEDGRTPERVADLLRECGYGASPMAVCEHLGGPQERIFGALAADWQEAAADLNLVAVDCVPAKGTRPLAQLGGLPDDAFLHDGQLTKREVRAVTLSALAPLPGELLWDVGAGCGSVAIEWMRAGGRAVAIEPRPDRCDRIARNAARLGVPELQVLRTSAPDGLPDGSPDAVFVGGGISRPGLLDACWAALAPGGRLVANAVTAEGEAELLRLRVRTGGDMTRLAVSRLAPVGGFHTWHPAMPVTQYMGWKR